MFYIFRKYTKKLLTLSAVFYTLLYVMLALAVVVFVALFYFKAGYGYLGGGKWGFCINNTLAWILMEAPAFFVMATMTVRYFAQAVGSGHRSGSPVVVGIVAGFFLLHYFQRSFIFPCLIRGKGRMPVAIMAMGMVFNCINAWLIGKWLFCLCPGNMYSLKWLGSGYFIVGTALFVVGMFINLQSDYIIRHLRKPGDSAHYIPRKGLYKYVTSANYFGELVEWCGYAILTMSPSAFVFAIWTFANLAPRSKALTEKYIAEFGEEYSSLGKKNLIPFVW